MTGGIIAIVIVLIVVSGASISVSAYFRLQRHRADAVAMAEYRKLAEEAVAKQEALDHQVTDVRNRLVEIENLLRSVG